MSTVRAGNWLYRIVVIVMLIVIAFGIIIRIGSNTIGLQPDPFAVVTVYDDPIRICPGGTVDFILKTKFNKAPLYVSLHRSIYWEDENRTVYRYTAWPTSSSRIREWTDINRTLAVPGWLEPGHYTLETVGVVEGHHDTGYGIPFEIVSCE